MARKDTQSRLGENKPGAGATGRHARTHVAYARAARVRTRAACTRPTRRGEGTRARMNAARA
eukprot:3806722-Pleurochrysis_carterae.AAC.1